MFFAVIIVIFVLIIAFFFWTAYYNERKQMKEFEEMDAYSKQTKKELLLCLDSLNDNYKKLSTDSPQALNYIKTYATKVPAAIDLERFSIVKYGLYLCFIEKASYIKNQIDFKIDRLLMLKSEADRTTQLEKYKQEYRTYNLRTMYIPIKDIEYFIMEGNKFAVTEISGGGGGGKIGGNSLSGGIVGTGIGAVVGGGFGAGVGAIIGSRKESNITIDPIKSTTTIHDETKCYLKYRRSDGSLAELSSPKSSERFFNKLRSLIPEKEYNFVLSHQNKQSNDSDKNSIEDRINKLNSLREKGLISQEQYEKKHQEIIDSI